MSESISVHVGFMTRRNLPEVMQIEERCFEFPWSEDDFFSSLGQRKCIGMVAKQDDHVIGFMIYELHERRLHVLNFAVNPWFARRGVGRAMIEKLTGKLSEERRDRIMLEVREGNLNAQLFFKSMGFKAISILRNFYDESNESAYLMHYCIESRKTEEHTPLNRISRIKDLHGC